MSDQPHTSEFVADVDGFIGPILTAAKALDTAASAGERVRSAFVSFDKAGNQIGQTLRLTSEQLGDISVSLKRTEDGWRATGASISENTRKLQEQARAARESAKALEENLNALSAFRVGTAGRSGVPASVSISASGQQELSDISSTVAAQKQLGQTNFLVNQQIKAENRKTTEQLAKDWGDALIREASDLEKIHAREERETQQFVARTRAYLNQLALQTAKDVETTQNAQAGRAIATPLAKNFQATAIDLTPEKAARAGQLIASIQQQVASGNVTFSRALEVMNAGLTNQVQILTPHEATLLRTSQALQDLGKNSQQTAQTFNLSWQAIFRIASIQVLHRFVYSLIDAFKAAATESIAFQIKISEIRTISQDTGLSFDQWSKSIRRLSDEFGNPITDVAKGAYETISNQIAKGADATIFLEKALRFSQATVSTTAESVDLLSSALNAYQLKAQDTDRVSAILFKTIDLGRVRASEMASTFGRVAVPASQLGVTLEETAAAIATLTINGVKASEAFTQLNTLFVALLKPSEPMKKFLADLGVGSGEAAIATFGFEGVLKKLNETAGGSSTELANLVKNARGLRGAIGLTSDFEGFQKNLQGITGAANEFNKAVEIATESAGFKLQKQLVQTKNALIADFGTPLTKVLVEVSDAFGGLSNITETVVRGGATLVTAFAAVRTAAFFNAAGINAAALANLTYATSMRTIGAAVGSVISSPFVLISLGLAIVQYARHLREEAINLQQTVTDEYRKGLEANAQNLVREQEREKLIFDAAIKDRFQGYLQLAADVKRLSADSLQQRINDEKEVAEATKAIISVRLEEEKRGIQDLEKTRREALTNIEKAQKSLEDNQRNAEKRDYERRLALSSDSDRSGLFTAREKQLRGQAATLYSTADQPGHENDLAEGAKKLAEALDILQEKFRRTLEVRKELVEIGKREQELQTRDQARTGVEDLANQSRDVSLSRARFGARNNATRLGFVNQKSDADEERNAASAAEEHRRIQQQLADLEERRKKLVQEYGAVDLRTPQQELNNLKREEVSILQLQKRITDDLQRVEQQRADAATQKIEQERLRVASLQQVFKDIAEFKLPKGTLDEKTLDATVAKFDDLISRAKEFGLTDQATQLQLQRERASIINVGEGILSSQDVDKTTQRITAIRDSYTKALDDIQAKQKQTQEQTDALTATFVGAATSFSNQGLSRLGTAPQLQADMDALIEKVKKFGATVNDQKEFFRIFTSAFQQQNQAGLQSNLGTNPDGSPRTPETVGQAAGTALSKLIAASQQKVSADNAFKILTDEAKRADINIQDATKAINAAKQAGDEFGEGFRKQLRDTATETINLTKHLQDMKRTLVVPTAPGGGQAPGFALGSFGSPRGVDVVPAWLRPGEMVMNPGATQAFFPLLRSLNMRGQDPQYFANGGEVNFGGVEINIASSGSTDIDARELWTKFENLGRLGIINMRGRQ